MASRPGRSWRWTVQVAADPGLGQPTREILTALGYGPQRQAGLAERGVIPDR